MGAIDDLAKLLDIGGKVIKGEMTLEEVFTAPDETPAEPGKGGAVRTLRVVPSTTVTASAAPPKTDPAPPADDTTKP